MDPFVPSQRRPHLLRRLSRRARALTPLGAWLLAIAALVALLRQRQLPSPVQGLVEVTTTTVRTPVAGRLHTVAVALHTAVHQGQLLARLDDSDLRLRLAAARANLEQLRAELSERQAELEHDNARNAADADFDRRVELRRMADSAEAAQIDHLSTRAQLEEARVRLRGTRIEVERLQQLGTQGLVADTDLVRARTEQDALQQRITELESVQVSQAQRCEAIAHRQQQFTAATSAPLPVDAALSPLRWRLRAQEAELERLALATTQLDLSAPSAGVVASLPHQQGEWLLAGDTVLAIVEPLPRQIRAYVPAALLDRYARAAAVPFACSSQPMVVRQANVLSISPAPVLVPEALWRLPRQQEWAFEVVLSASGSELPGERVQVQLPPE